MKNIKAFCVMLFLSASFIACEEDSITGDSEISIENIDVIGEDEADTIEPKG